MNVRTQLPSLSHVSVEDTFAMNVIILEWNLVMGFSHAREYDLYIRLV